MKLCSCRPPRHKEIGERNCKLAPGLDISFEMSIADVFEIDAVLESVAHIGNRVEYATPRKKASARSRRALYAMVDGAVQLGCGRR
jgi:hypothetical protein